MFARNLFHQTRYKGRFCYCLTRIADDLLFPSLKSLRLYTYCPRLMQVNYGLSRQGFPGL